MKIFQRINRDGADILLISSDSFEWNCLCRIVGQSQVGDDPEEIDLNKANKALLRLADSRKHLEGLIKELDEYASKNNPR